MIPKNVERFAKNQGGIGAEPFEMKWDGFSVYRLIPCKGYEKMCLGTPIFILASEKGERLATLDEAEAIMEEKYSDVEYEDD